QARIDDRAFGHEQFDRPHVAFAIRDVGRADAAYGAEGRRPRHGDWRVDRAVDLRRGAGEVDRQAVAADLHRTFDAHGLGILAQAVDEVDGTPGAVRNAGDGA